MRHVSPNLPKLIAGFWLLGNAAIAQPAVPETEPGAPVEAEAPSPLPEDLVADLERIFQGLNLHPGATLLALAPEIGAQASALPGVLEQGLRELNGDPVPQSLGEIRLGLLVALGVCVVMGVIALLSKSWLAVAFVFGLLVAPLLAAVSGFVALSLAVFALAVVSPILARVIPVALRAALSRSDTASGDERWRPHPNRVAQPAQDSARPPAPATHGRKVSRPPPNVRSPAAAHSAAAQALPPVDLPALKQHVESVVGDLLPRPRGWQIAALVVLFVVAPALAVFALLGLLGYYAFKLLTLDASKRERLLANPQIRERLRHLQQSRPELYQALSRLQESLLRTARGGH